MTFRGTVLLLLIAGCGGAPLESQCVAPFANAAIDYAFCAPGATARRAVCTWSGGNPPYPIQGAGACQGGRRRSSASMRATEMTFRGHCSRNFTAWIKENLR